MRVLIVPLPLAQHYYPMVSLAWALRAAGHDVRVASQPALADTITRSGMPAVLVGGDYDHVEDAVNTLQESPETANHGADLTVDDYMALPAEIRAQLAEVRLAPFVRLSELIAEDLVPFARLWRPELVIADPMIFAAPIVAELVGAPLVRSLWGVDITSYMRFPGQGREGATGGQDPWPRDLVRLYERYGVEVRESYGVASVDPSPLSMQLPGVPNRIPVRYVPYNGPGTVPTWAVETPDRPRICVTWGTSTTRLMGPGGFLVPQILESLRGFDVDIVVAISSHERELLGDVAENVRVVERLPLSLILPSCQAIIHQAGAGTVLTSAVHGVPQVAVRQLGEQHITAALLASTGAGVSLVPTDLRTDAFATAVRTVLDDAATREAARSLSAEMLAQPAPTDIVGDLEKLAASSL